MENTINLFKVNMNTDLNDVLNTLKSGMITQGKKVEEFEEKLKVYFDYPYILTLNSATSGLTLAYRLLDLDQTKDLVISTPLTCFATNCPILDNNLNIVWADTDPNTCNIDLEDVKNKITENTKALTFVHWGGNPVDLDKVDELKNYTKEKFGHDLHIIEDCAHAFGSTFNNKKLGTHGNICVFSLQAIKHLTTGDGGLIFLPNETVYKRAKLLRWFGIDRDKRSLPGKDFRLEPDIPEYGYKFHMNDINATIGLCNLVNIDSSLDICRNNGEYYNKELQNINGIQLFKSENSPCYWIYTLKVLFNFKNEFINFMKEKGIVTSQVHARNDRHSCLEKYKTILPNLDILENEIVSIPVGWWVTKEQREYIVKCIKEFSSSLSIEITTLKEEEIDEYKKLIYQLNNFEGDKIFMSKSTIDSIYVLKVNGKIVSTCKLLVEEKLYSLMGHIEDVVTDKDFRKNGYGKYLVNQVVNIALNKLNCYKVVLSCKNELEKFYKKCGLQTSGKTMNLYKIK